MKLQVWFGSAGSVSSVLLRRYIPAFANMVVLPKRGQKAEVLRAAWFGGYHIVVKVPDMFGLLVDVTATIDILTLGMATLHARSLSLARRPRAGHGTMALALPPCRYSPLAN